VIREIPDERLLAGVHHQIAELPPGLGIDLRRVGAGPQITGEVPSLADRFTQDFSAAGLIDVGVLPRLVEPQGQFAPVGADAALLPLCDPDLRDLHVISGIEACTVGPLGHMKEGFPGLPAFSSPHLPVLSIEKIHSSIHPLPIHTEGLELYTPELDIRLVCTIG